MTVNDCLKFVTKSMKEDAEMVKWWGHVPGYPSKPRSIEYWINKYNEKHKTEISLNDIKKLMIIQ